MSQDLLKPKTEAEILAQLEILKSGILFGTDVKNSTLVQHCAEHRDLQFAYCKVTLTMLAVQQFAKELDSEAKITFAGDSVLGVATSEETATKIIRFAKFAALKILQDIHSHSMSIGSEQNQLNPTDLPIYDYNGSIVGPGTGKFDKSMKQKSKTELYSNPPTIDDRDAYDNEQNEFDKKYNQIISKLVAVTVPSDPNTFALSVKLPEDKTKFIEIYPKLMNLIKKFGLKINSDKFINADRTTLINNEGRIQLYTEKAELKFTQHEPKTIEPSDLLLNATITFDSEQDKAIFENELKEILHTNYSYGLQECRRISTYGILDDDNSIIAWYRGGEYVLAAYERKKKSQSAITEP